MVRHVAKDPSGTGHLELDGNTNAGFSKLAQEDSLGFLDKLLSEPTSRWREKIADLDRKIQPHTIFIENYNRLLRLQDELKPLIDELRKFGIPLTVADLDPTKIGFLDKQMTDIAARLSRITNNDETANRNRALYRTALRIISDALPIITLAQQAADTLGVRAEQPYHEGLLRQVEANLAELIGMRTGFDILLRRILAFHARVEDALGGMEHASTASVEAGTFADRVVLPMHRIDTGKIRPESLPAFNDLVSRLGDFLDGLVPERRVTGDVPLPQPATPPARAVAGAPPLPGLVPRAPAAALPKIPQPRKAEVDPGFVAGVSPNSTASAAGYMKYPSYSFKPQLKLAPERAKKIVDELIIMIQSIVAASERPISIAVGRNRQLFDLIYLGRKLVRISKGKQEIHPADPPVKNLDIIPATSDNELVELLCWVAGATDASDKSQSHIAELIVTACEELKKNPRLLNSQRASK